MLEVVEVRKVGERLRRCGLVRTDGARWWRMVKRW